MAIKMDVIKKGLGDIPPVETSEFHHAIELMSESFAKGCTASAGQKFGAIDVDGKRVAFELNDSPFLRGIQTITDYCDNKYQVTDKHPDDEQTIKAHQLFSGLSGRVFCWFKFLRENIDLLRSRELAHEDSYHEVLEDVAAYLPLHSSKGYDPEEVIAEADRRLGRDHVPVLAMPCVVEEEPSIKTLHELENSGLINIKAEVPWSGYHEEMEEFIETFAVARTIFAHVDPETQTATLSDDDLHREVNEWLKSNPVFTKQDLVCMKSLLRKSGIPKLIWQTLTQDMRGKTYRDLCKAVLPVEEEDDGS